MPPKSSPKKSSSRGKTAMSKSVVDRPFSNFVSFESGGTRVVERHMMCAFAPIAIITTGAGDYHYSYEFKLNDFYGSTDLKNLYNEYCIKMVEFQLVPSHTESLASSGSISGSLGHIVCVVDPDDATVPTSVGVLLEYSNVQIAELNQIYKISLTPRVAQTVYDTPLNAAYAVPQTGVWLSTADGTVPHYGVKFTIRMQGQGEADLYPYVRAKISFRSTR